MSGGGGKKRTSRAQGWEEAGAEFYQERYPTTDVDLEVLQRDPTRIATLLPSKQSRAATAKRVRPTDTRTLRRRTSTRNRRESSARRASTTLDVQVAMLPDLSENLSNEQTTWEEIMQIKAMPVPMAQKKELKAKLQMLQVQSSRSYEMFYESQNATHLRLQGFEQLSWQRRKVWQQFKVRLKEAYSKLELWKKSLKKIEGNFGTGVVAYFLFVKWLMFLNLAIFILIFIFVILPTILFDDSQIDEAVNNNENISLTEYCTDEYYNQSAEVSMLGLDLIQGTGSMERTILFYGKYANKIFLFDSGLYYNLPLAYTSVTIAYFLISLIAIIKAAARGFKERLVEGEGQFYHYCNLVFGGWDFCIHNEKSAVIKHKALYNELKACLEAERLEEERKNRSREEKTKLIIIRSIINIFVIAILMFSMALIYFVFDFSVAQLENNNHNYFIFILEFLPSVCIVTLNLIVPPLFKYFVGFENYSPAFVVRITLLRTVILRLASLGVLVFKFYILTSCARPYLNECISDKCNKYEYNNTQCASERCKTPFCWETYVGQQIYKLLLTDFLTHIFVTFVINLPRALIAKHFDNKFAKFIGEQQFDLPKHVLDVVYSQTLCWLGSFFAPMLPAIATMCFFLIFYIKKFACLVNSTPSSTVYRASRSNSMFMIVLLVAHFLAVVPVAYSIAEIMPSLSCGPYRGLDSVWTYVIDTFDRFPDFIRKIVFGVGTAWFSIPMFIFLTLCLYYYSAVSAANKHMVSVLKNQLVLEGHDKQFLLNRLSDFIKQQQEYQKRIRSAEMLREHERVNASN